MADPRDQHRSPLVSSRSTRAIPAQGTSHTAFPGQLPEDDDPLLGFAPYLHPFPRSNSITPDLQRRFVATLAATGIVRQAARSIGKSLEALYKLRARKGAEAVDGNRGGAPTVQVGRESTRRSVSVGAHGR